MPKYIISDGRGQYIRRNNSGNYVPVKNKDLADEYDKMLKASNVLKNCVAANLRNQYKVVEIDIENRSSPPPRKTDIYVVKPKDKAAKKIGCEEIEENRIPNLSAAINNILDVINDTERRGIELSNALSDVDQEISDIHHYIEFGKFNAYQGYLAFSMLKNRLKRRRKIKDELYILNLFGDCKLNSSTILSIKTEIENLNNRKYIPRKLTELF